MTNPRRARNAAAIKTQTLLLLFGTYTLLAIGRWTVNRHRVAIHFHRFGFGFGFGPLGWVTQDQIASVTSPMGATPLWESAFLPERNCGAGATPTGPGLFSFLSLFLLWLLFFLSGGIPRGAASVAQEKLCFPRSYVHDPPLPPRPSDLPARTTAM